MIRRKCREAEYVVGGRYGYYAVDLKCRDTGAVIDTIITGITKKNAEIIARALNKELQSTERCGAYHHSIERWCKRK